MDHLNDDLVQAFLDGTQSRPEQQRVQEHLKRCSRCNVLVREYRHLYSELGEEPAFELSAAFTKSVVKKVRKPGTTPVQSTLLTLFFGFAAVIVAINLVFYYVDVQSMYATIKAGWAPVWEFLPGLLKLAGAQVDSEGFNIQYIVIGGIILLFLFIIDRVLNKTKQRPLSSF